MATATITTDPHNTFDASEMDREEDGVEIEQEDPQDRITEPFDPEKIRIRTVNIVVEQLTSRIAYDEIDLAPDFQRETGIWNRTNKSRLIESLMLKIPIPVFYVAADTNERWSVVDGVQRMSTINSYMCGDFKLERLEYLTTMEGLEFEELPRPMQRRISETQLIINVIEPGTPQEVMFNVFLRINTGGLTLNRQEIRHALNPGPVRGFLKRLANSNEFLVATDNSIPQRRMRDRECVLRFLAFDINSPEDYSAKSLDGFLGATMQAINEMETAQLVRLQADFKKAMETSFSIFGENAFRKPPTETGRRRAISMALFETWGVQLARRSNDQIAGLVKRREDINTMFSMLIEDDNEFNRSISYSTGDPRLVRKRFDAIDWIIQEFI